MQDLQITCRLAQYNTSLNRNLLLNYIKIEDKKRAREKRFNFITEHNVENREILIMIRNFRHINEKQFLIYLKYVINIVDIEQFEHD